MSSWNDSLLIEVTLIDDQHKELIRRMDELVEACSCGDGCSEVGQTLKFVVSYIKEHFKDEEELQALYAYPDIEAHKELHAQFVQRAIDLVQELKLTGPSDFLTDKVKRTLVGWFIMHIRTEDKKVGAHIHSAEGRATR